MTTLTTDVRPARRRTDALPVRVPFAIGGLGAVVPAHRRTNHDLEQHIDSTDAWIVERTGIRERRILGDGVGTSDLAREASSAALRDAGVPAADIGLLVMATCTPDQPLPATSALVARDLGISGAAFDLNAACSGWVYGLVTAASLMLTTSASAGLLIGADVMSRWMDPTDRGTLPLFGDGAGATVLLPSFDTGGPGLMAWDMGVDGTGTDLIEVPAGGSRLPASEATLAAGDHYLKMQGREVFRRAVRSVETSCQSVLDLAGVSADEVGLFVPHQANARIVDAIRPRLGIPAERTMVNIDRYGNTSAASIPLALCEAAASGRLADGDLVLVAGFGAGMTWATALLRWGYRGRGPEPTADLQA